jgi:CheY-like chemotaxis protein
VTIGCEATAMSDDNYEIHFSVSDTGIGIAAEDIDRLFQPFTQANISTTREYGGTGLGLVICRRLIELMQGKIWIESELGRGATFHFTIRAAAIDLHPSQPLATTDSPPLATDRTLGETLPLKILIAEDNQINQELALAMFARLGYAPEIVINGLEAIAAVRSKAYDLLFLDLHMPKMDGIETTKYLVREWKNFGLTYPRPKIIAMTANAMQGDREVCLDAGMDDYISKPIFMDVLEQTVCKWGCSLHSGTSTATIDLTALDRLREISPTLLDRLIPLFINEEAPKLLSSIGASLIAGDAAQISDAAHTLKGTSSALGAVRLARLCQQVETQTGQGNLNGIDSLLVQTQAEYDLVYQELSKIITHNSLN